MDTLKILGNALLIGGSIATAANGILEKQRRDKMIDETIDKKLNEREKKKES